MRSYRLYENMKPEANLSGEHFDLVSQVNESMMLSRIFTVVRQDIVKQGMGKCKRIVFDHQEDRDLCLRNYYDLMLIMRNLLTGSIQAGADEIRVRSEIEHEHLVITVADDGKGIRKEDKPYMFHPRRVEKEGTKETDHGLLLYNIRKAVINSKGKLEMHSVEGHGTTCVLKFPMSSILAGPDQSEIIMNPVR